MSDTPVDAAGEPARAPNPVAAFAQAVVLVLRDGRHPLAGSVWERLKAAAEALDGQSVSTDAPDLAALEARVAALEAAATAKGAAKAA